MTSHKCKISEVNNVKIIDFICEITKFCNDAIRKLLLPMPQYNIESTAM